MFQTVKCLQVNRNLCARDAVEKTPPDLLTLIDIIVKLQYGGVASGSWDT